MDCCMYTSIGLTANCFDAIEKYSFFLTGEQNLKCTLYIGFIHLCRNRYMTSNNFISFLKQWNSNTVLQHDGASGDESNINC